MERIGAMEENVPAMHKIKETLASSPEIEGVLAAVAAQIGDALHVSLVDIYQFSPDHDVLLCEATWRRTGIAKADHGYVGSLTDLRERPEWRRAIDERVVVERRVDDPAIPPEDRASLVKWGFLASLAAPLLVADEVVGLVSVAQLGYVRSFGQPELDLFLRLSLLASLAIANARMLRKEEVHTRRLTSLLDASRFIAASHDASEMVDRVESELHRAYGSLLEGCSMRLMAADGRLLPAHEVPAVGEPAATSETDGRVDSVVDAMLKRRKPTQVLAPGERERLVVPLEARSEIVGYLELVSCPGRHFCPADVELLQIVANQAAVAVQNAALYHDIEHQARTDGLTGLYNHRYFLDRLSQEFARSLRMGGSLGLLMIDVDGFKQYNDTWGHQEGDAALVRIAGVIESEVRESIDLVGRYGGDEFAVLLPELGGEGNTGGLADGVAPAGCCAVAERIRTAVERLDWEATDSDPSRALTVSIGCAPMHPSEMHASQLVSRADRALYAAKREGRNRVAELCAT
jgi:diguanylate cyclase (GGDEF)-like protein